MILYALLGVGVGVLIRFLYEKSEANRLEGKKSISIEEFNALNKETYEIVFICESGYEELNIEGLKKISNYDFSTFKKTKDITKIPFDTNKDIILCLSNQKWLYDIEKLSEKFGFSYQYLGSYQSLKQVFEDEE